MSQSLQNLATSLQELENEIGLESLTQLLADTLLACSARTVGDALNNWTVNTDFVKGEVSAITDIALTNIKADK